MSQSRAVQGSEKRKRRDAANIVLRDALVKYEELRRARDGFVAAVRKVEKVLPDLDRRGRKGYTGILKSVGTGSAWPLKFMKEKWMMVMEDKSKEGEEHAE
jgi:hypothetical protein